MDILYTLNLGQPPAYLINIISNNLLYESVIKERMEYIDFHIGDEQGSYIDFNVDV